MKNYFFILIYSTLFFSCKQENRTNPADFKPVQKKDSVLSGESTFTLLTYGELPPVLYNNAQDIIGKKYNIQFKETAGCEVNEKLIDSIKTFNDKTTFQMNEFYKREMKGEINAGINSEFTYLTSLDRKLRTLVKRNNVILIYFVKKLSRYKAFYLFGMPTQSKLQFKIKVVVEIDSAGQKIIEVSDKDELLPIYFRNLQYDKNY